MSAAAPKEIEYEDGLRLVPKLLAKGRVEVAAKWASRLCAHRPDDPRAHNQAGLALQRRNGPDAAVAPFPRALVLPPNDRQRVEEGKGGTGRVDLGGRRFSKKKK